MRLHELYVGKPKPEVLPQGGELTTGMRRSLAADRVLVGPTRLVGDGSAYEAHQGPDTAVHLFARENYRFFESRAGRSFPSPLFGENFLVEGYDENSARVGDVVRVGSALFEVSQPAERCSNIGKVAGEPRILKWILESLHTGFYFRVVETGEVGAGDPIELQEQGPQFASVVELNRLLFRMHAEDASAKALCERVLALDSLGAPFRHSLKEKFS